MDIFMQKVYGVHYLNGSVQYVQTYFVAFWKYFIENGTLDKISINVGFLLCRRLRSGKKKKEFEWRISSVEIHCSTMLPRFRKET